MEGSLAPDTSPSIGLIGSPTRLQSSRCGADQGWEQRLLASYPRTVIGSSSLCQSPFCILPEILTQEWSNLLVSCSNFLNPAFPNLLSLSLIHI